MFADPQTIKATCRVLGLVLSTALPFAIAVIAGGCGATGSSEEADSGQVDLAQEPSGDAGATDANHVHADAGTDASHVRADAATDAHHPGMDAASDAASPRDASVPPSDAAVDADASDAGTVTVQGCIVFVDRTTADRTLMWNFDVADDPSRCMDIAAGQSVTWSGNFSFHPLSGLGGTLPSPIPGIPPDDGSHAIEFPVPGTYGFICDSHPEMRGAIRVSPP